MSIETTVYNKLESVLPGNVHPVVVPANATRPAISYMVASTNLSDSMDCVSGITSQLMQVDVMGDTYLQTVETSNLVIAGMAELNARLTLMLDMDDLAPSIYRRILRFDVWN